MKLVKQRIQDLIDKAKLGEKISEADLTFAARCFMLWMVLRDPNWFAITINQLNKMEEATHGTSICGA